MSIELGDEVSLQIAVETTARKIVFILLSVTLRWVVVGRKSRSLANWWCVSPLSAVVVALLPCHTLLRGFTFCRVGIYSDVDLSARRGMGTPSGSGWQRELGDLKFAAIRGARGLGRRI